MSSISRTANLLLRSSKASLLRPRAINPVQHVFGNNKLAARGLASAFERTKPHVNIGTIGHVDHGKVAPKLPSRFQPSRTGLVHCSHIL
jgi:elongation factor Tu